MSRLFCKSLD